MKQLLSVLPTLIICVLLASCSSKENPTNTTIPDVTNLKAFKVTNPGDLPSVNTATVESIWQNATSLTFTASKIGANFSGSDRTFTVDVKSIVSDNDIYFLVQYDDPTEDYLRTPLAFLGGDPTDPTRWTKLNAYDDGVSMIFEMTPGTSGAMTFAANGCAMLCHTSATAVANAGMYSEDTGKYDLWYWHSGKSNGSGVADDDAVLGVPNFGILTDDNNAENYQNNILDGPTSGYTPYKIAGGNNRNLSKSDFIASETAVIFANNSTINPATGAAWKSGDRVPGYTIANPTPTSSDFFDVQSKGYWANGKWTVKFHRKLITNNSGSDLVLVSAHQYLFSLAIHDNNSPNNHYGASQKAFKLIIP